MKTFKEFLQDKKLEKEGSRTSASARRLGRLVRRQKSKRFKVRTVAATVGVRG